MDTNTPTNCSVNYPLFEHMSREHGLTLTESEMSEIVRIAGTQLTARAEAAESLNAEFKRAGLAILADPESRHIHLTSLPELRGVMSRSPASMVSKLAELEKEQKRLLQVAYDRYAVRRDAFEKNEDTLRARLAEQDAELARLREELSAFKAFHKSLCVRFSYSHDERDWRRDLVSLEEHIALERDALRARVSELERDYDSRGRLLADEARLRKEVQSELALEKQAHASSVRACEAVESAHRELTDVNDLVAGQLDASADDCLREHDRADKAEQRAERLADALRFIKEECDWETPRGEFGGGGDDRIGPAIEAALADQPAQANTREAALIAALEVMSGVNDLDGRLRILASAKQGAQPVEKHPDTLRLDYLDEVRADILRPSEDAGPVEVCVDTWDPANNEWSHDKLVAGEGRTIRAAIDAARKTEGAS